MYSVYQGKENDMSRVMLISPPTPWDSYLIQTELFPNGALLQLGSILLAARHKVKVIHMLADNVTYQSLEEQIKEFKPDIVGITMVTFQAKTGRRVCSIIKSISKDITIAIGGSHVSAIAEEGDTRYPDADIKVIGEGDNIIKQIASGTVVKGTYTTTTVQNFDELPFWNLDLVNLKKFTGIYPPGPLPSINIIGSRGCPFNCTFCSKPVFGNKVRYRTPQRIVEEIKYYKERWGIREFFFQDDTFNTNTKWVWELLDRILQAGLNKKIAYRARCRVNEKLIDSNLLQTMRRAGFWEIFYGVESGNQNMLDDMKKDITIEEVKRAFKLTREAKIKTEASFIIGMPGETEDTILDSIRLWKELKPDWCSFSRAIPFPGTEFAKAIKHNGHMLVKDYEDFKLDATLVRTNALDKDTLEYYATMINNMVNKDRLKKLAQHPLELARIIKDTGITKGIKKAWQVLR